MDGLATIARQKYSLEELKAQETHVFLGSQAAVKVDHRVENNGLYKILKHSIQGRELRQYLMEKYDWDQSTFSTIDWTAHNRELNKISRRKKPTLLKYIHGWLARNTRRYYEGQSKTDGCPLCGVPETRAHLFCCAHEQISILRDIYWKIFLKELFKETAVGFREVFLSGLNTIQGMESPSPRTQTDWPRAYQEAYTNQEKVGWCQVLFGRLTRQWDILAQYTPVRGIEYREGVWTQRAIRLGWQFGLEVWTIRNQLTHGTGVGASTRERQRIKQVIQVLCRELIPTLPPNEGSFFARPETELLLLPYQNQVAWLGQVKFMYPTQYRKILSNEQSRDQTSQEVEYNILTQITQDIE